MKTLFALGILVTLSAQAQVQTQVYVESVNRIQGFAPNPFPPEYVASKIVPYNNYNVVRIPVQVTLPSRPNTLPGQTEEQRRRMESLSR
jgi:hypothetical protein